MGLIIKYIPQNHVITVKVEIADIESTDLVLLYNNGDLLATLKSVIDPAFPTFYTFTFTRRINTTDGYSYSWKLSDEFSNIGSDQGGQGASAVELTPQAPNAIPYQDISFDGNTSGTSDISADTISQFKLNDAEADTIIVDATAGGDGDYGGGANTEDRTVAGKINTALTFDGLSDYIDTNFPYQTYLRNSFSINVWVKPVDATPFGEQAIFGAFNGGAQLFALGLTGTDAYVQYREGTNFVSSAGTSGMTNNKWHMVTVMGEDIGGTQLKISIYVDNVLVNTPSAQTAIMANYTSGFNCYIGAINSSGSDGNNFEGAIDNFVFVSRLLTAQERDFLFAGGDGTELLASDFSDGFQTVFHKDVDTLAVTEDGDYGLNVGIGVDLPPDADYVFYRTVTVDNGTPIESANSNDTYVTIQTTVPSQIPKSDPHSLFLTNRAGGTFGLSFSYDTQAGDPITGWNVYVDNTGNPSIGGDWTLDGQVSWSGITSKFGYITQPQLNGVLTNFKVVPVAVAEERNNEIYVSGTADAQAPTQSGGDFNVTLE